MKMACKSSLNRPQDRKTRRCLDQRDGSQALGDVGKESLKRQERHNEGTLTVLLSTKSLVQQDGGKTGARI